MSAEDEAKANAAASEAAIDAQPTETAEVTPWMRKISDLRQHPISLEIYGENEDVSDLVPSIKTHGVTNPITIKPDGTILSGHRRYRAARIAGLTEVPCFVARLANEEEEQILIVEANRTRTKTPEQLIREGKRLQAAFESLAKKNQTAHLKQNLFSQDNSTDTVRLKTNRTVGAHPTRDAVASALNIKAHVWQGLSYIDKYASIGNETAQEALNLYSKGKISITAAVKMVRKSLREQNDGEPEREPTFFETCLAQAEKYTQALSSILTQVLDAPDEDFNSAMWMAYSEDLGYLAECSKRMDDKIDRKTIKTMREIQADPVKRAAFENGELREGN